MTYEIWLDEDEEGYESIAIYKEGTFHEGCGTGKKLKLIAGFPNDVPYRFIHRVADEARAELDFSPGFVG
jgi:hypothetical protein